MGMIRECARLDEASIGRAEPLKVTQLYLDLDAEPDGFDPDLNEDPIPAAPLDDDALHPPKRPLRDPHARAPPNNGCRHRKASRLRRHRLQAAYTFDHFVTDRGGCAIVTHDCHYPRRTEDLRRRILPEAHEDVTGKERPIHDRLPVMPLTLLGNERKKRLEVPLAQPLIDPFLVAGPGVERVPAGRCKAPLCARRSLLRLYF
jgi:hypothetical protein